MGSQYIQSNRESSFDYTCHRDKLQEEYWSLLSKTEQHNNSRFVEILRGQSASEQERGRAAVLTFSNSGSATTKSFAHSNELKIHLDDAANQNPRIDACRKLYLLEDIARNYIEVLGSRLCIPPAFFSAQWTDPSFSGPITDPKIFSQDRKRYFQLKYSQIHSLREDDKAENYQVGLYYDPKGNVDRRLQLLDNDSPFEMSKHQISYWGNSFDGHSWVAVLLLDPLITEALITEHYATNGQHTIHLDPPESGSNHFPCAKYQSMHPLSSNPRQWKLEPQPLRMLPIFDNLLTVHAHANNAWITNDPLSATYVCRNLIRCSWEMYIACQTVEYHKNLDKFLFRNRVSNASTWFQTWDLAWPADVFRKLAYTKIVIEAAITKDIDANLKALGIGYSDTMLSLNETEDWTRLQSSGALLAKKYATFTDAYLQESTFQESRTSNHQARSLGRLTTLATVLIPLSTIASIFSMGGNFLPGQNQFWIFWVVTIPIVATLSVVLFTGVLQSSRRVLVSLWKKCSWWIRERWFRLFTGRRNEDSEASASFVGSKLSGRSA